MNTSPQYQLITKRILELVEANGYKRGDKLPPERKLAEQFHVSRNCIREALRTLAEAGVLESRHGDGTYFKGTDFSSIMKTVTSAVSRHHERIGEIFELRHMLEPQIAALAAKRITREQLDALKAVVFDQHQAVLKQQDDSQQDGKFHRILAEAANNTAVLEVLDASQALIDDTRIAPLRNESRGLASVTGHMRIVDALENGDSEEARKAMEDHLCEIEQTTMN